MTLSRKEEHETDRLSTELVARFGADVVKIRDKNSDLKTRLSVLRAKYIELRDSPTRRR